MNIDVARIIGTSEFRAHTARIFDEVANGATFVVTRGARPVVVISPVPKDVGAPAVTLPTSAPFNLADTDPIDIE